MKKSERIAFQMPKPVKDILKAKIGYRLISGYIRDLIQRDFCRCNIMLCVECGSTNIKKVQVEDQNRYTCLDCNHQWMILER